VRNSAFNGNYVVNVLGGYEVRVGSNSWLTLDMKSVLAGGRRYVPTDLVQSAADSRQRFDWSNAYSNRYNHYFRVDVRVGYKTNHAKWSQEWGLDLQNVTGYKSVFAEGYDVDKNELYKIYQQGFLPMMLYRIRF
jgi:hypothetical protein